MSSRFIEASRANGAEGEETAPKEVERRVSLWMSQASSSNRRNSSITDRRISMHLNRRSQLNVSIDGRATISSDGVDGGETNSTDKERLVSRADGGLSAFDNEEVVLKGDFHREMYILLKSYIVEMFILVVILLNTISLIIQTSVDVEARAGWYLELLESVFMAIFLAEVLLKIYVYRLRYFLDVWNLIDFVIVVLNIIDLSLSIADVMRLRLFVPTTVFRLLRILRSLRALHLFSFLRPFRFFSTLQVILVTIERSAMPMGIIALMMMYVIYLFSVIGRGLYGELDLRFRSIPKTMFTLYLMLTLDDWYFIPLAIEAKGVYHCFYYLFVYIFVNVYIFLNLFVAVICDNFQYAWLEEKEEQRQRTLKHTGSFSNMQEELEEHEDDDSLIDAVTSVGDGGSEFSDDDDDFNERTIKEFYPDASEGEQQLMESFFLAAAALENSCFKLLEMQHVLDMLVDVAADASEDTA